MVSHSWELQNGTLRVNKLQKPLFSLNFSPCFPPPPTYFESETLSRVWLFANQWTVHGILQARIMEWVAIPFSRGSSQTRDWTQVSCIAGRLFAIWATREAQARILEWVPYPFSSKSSQFRNQTGVSCIAGGLFTNWAIREDPFKTPVDFNS